MKIAIEAQRIFRTNKHGMDFVILECIRELQKIDHINEYFIFVSTGKDICLFETENFHIVVINCPTYFLWEQVALPVYIKSIHPDLLHCTSNTAPLFCSVPLVLTLHDIIFLEKREKSKQSLYQKLGWYYRKCVVPCILSKCKKIITVSKYECSTIIDTLNIESDKVIAVYNGYNKYFRIKEKDESIIEKYIKNCNFIFYLGNTDPKKNAIRVLIAYSEYLTKSKKKMPLLIADLDEEYIDDILEKNGIKWIKEFLFYPGYICNKDLVDLYNGAFVFLYPSLRESFGIPILEAMACGTPVIVGNTSAMPEIAGNDAILVDPYKSESIAEKLLLLETDNCYYKTQIDYGLCRVNSFSWNNTAKELLSIYNMVNSSL